METKEIIKIVMEKKEPELRDILRVLASQNEKIDNLDQCVQDMRLVLINGYSDQEMKRARDLTVEMANTYHYLKKFKNIGKIVIAMAVAPFFGLDMPVIIKAIENLIALIGK